MGENRHTKQDLQQLQALPLNLKIRLTQQRIREWVNEVFGVSEQLTIAREKNGRA